MRKIQRDKTMSQFKADAIRFDLAFDKFYQYCEKQFGTHTLIVFGPTLGESSQQHLSILYARIYGKMANSYEECVDLIVDQSDSVQTTCKYSLDISGFNEEKFTFNVVQLQDKIIPPAKLNKKISELSLQLSTRMQRKILQLRDYVVAMSLQTNDVTSFFHKAVTEGLREYFSYGAASAFYFDYDVNNLVLGATTGLTALKNIGFRRSQIRYDGDSKSWVRKCFESGTPILEVSSKNGSLKPTTYSEIDEEIKNRLFLPIDVRLNLRDRLNSTYGGQAASDGRVGVLRILNMSRNGILNPPSLLDMYLLEHFCEYLAVLGARYVRVLSAVHDQEKATHGFVTDLSTLRLRTQLFGLNIRSTISKFKGTTSDQLAEFATEIDGQLTLFERTFFAVQEGMAFQLETVLEFADGVVGDERELKARCERPFVEVIRRVAEASEFISANYGRKKAIFLFAGLPKPTDTFMKMPEIAIPSKTLNLAVRNLVENSIKYTNKQDTPHVDITWKLKGKNLLIGVSDRGIGIEAKDATRLFRESFRARNALATSTRGNGYGLFVSKRGLQKYGGDIAYLGQSSSGSGSVFQISVPVYY